MKIEPGMLLEATTASGEHVQLRAIGTPVKGRDFPVVWVCTEQEYRRAQETGEPASGLPWPLNAVEVLQPS